MKKIFVVLLLLVCLVTACTKEKFDAIEGTYQTEGIQVGCSYYYCDTVRIDSILTIEKQKDNSFHFTYYDPHNLGLITLNNIVNTKIIGNDLYFNTISTRIVINSNTGELELTFVGNDYSNHISDTTSYYTILKGQKL